MIFSRSRYARNIGAMLLLMLFTEYLCSITLFVHAHRIDNHVIVHSHPYSGTPDHPNHAHNAQQCKAIASLSSFTALAAAFFAPSAAAICRVDAYGVYRPMGTCAEAIRHYSLRAPPVSARVMN